MSIVFLLTFDSCYRQPNMPAWGLLLAHPYCGLNGRVYYC